MVGEENTRGVSTKASVRAVLWLPARAEKFLQTVGRGFISRRSRELEYAMAICESNGNGRLPCVKGGTEGGIVSLPWRRVRIRFVLAYGKAYCGGVTLGSLREGAVTEVTEGASGRKGYEVATLLRFLHTQAPPSSRGTISQAYGITRSPPAPLRSVQRG